MASKSKKHHFIPQSLLKQFRIEADGEYVFVYDKKIKQCFKSSIRDAGSENHFNTIIHNGKKIVLEDIFQGNDNFLADLINHITDKGTIEKLSQEDLNLLISVIATQTLRVKMMRTTLQDIARNLAVLLKEVGTDFELPGISDNDAKKQTLLFMQKSHERIFKGLHNKDVFIILAPEDSQFVISDNPVVLYNALPYSETGFSCAGVEVYFPISTQLALGLFCKTIYQKAKQYEPMFKTIDANYTRRTYDIIQGVERKKPIMFDSDNVLFFNSLQAENASRFIYSSSDDFSFIPPDVSEKKSKISFSEIGTVPRNTNMPKGKWFVVHGGYNGVMIKLLSYERDEDDSIVMITSDIVSAMAINGEHDIHISIFDDGYECSMIRHSYVTSTIKGENAEIIAEDIFMKKINRNVKRK